MKSEPNPSAQMPMGNARHGARVSGKDWESLKAGCGTVSAHVSFPDRQCSSVSINEIKIIAQAVMVDAEFAITATRPGSIAVSATSRFTVAQSDCLAFTDINREDRLVQKTFLRFRTLL